VAVEHFGYRTTLLLCGVAAALGAVAFTLGSRRGAGTRHPEKGHGSV
jgi:SET family sugar efflux transporter-like MFS transporter